MITAALVIAPLGTHQAAPPEADFSFLWSAYPESSGDDSVVSLPSIIEEYPQHLRAIYLSWLRSIPAATTTGGTIEDRLRIRPDLSYWWLSLPGDFPFSEDSPILPTIKMFALDMVCQERGVTRLLVMAGGASIREALRRWAANTDREIDFIGPSPVWTSDARAALHAAGTAAKYFVTSALRRGPNTGPNQGSASEGVALIDYLGPQEAESLSAGHFRSRYWGPLVDLLPRCGGAMWMHRRVSGTQWPQGSVAEPPASEGTHIDITDLASPRARLRGLRDYARVARRSFAVQKAPEIFVVPDTGVDAWPLLRTTWMQAFLGAHAMHNLMWLASMEDRLSAIPRQRLGVYLMENQPWEIALQSAWQRAGNGPLVGFAHTTVRFWDLRYALTGQALANRSRLCPLPDRIAVNGPAAHAEMRGFGVPDDLLVDVEAIRFLDAGGQDPSDSRPPTNTFTVLVLGEYWPEAAERQLHALDQARGHLPDHVEIVFRPHPAGTASPAGVGHVRLSSSPRTLTEDFEECDAILVGETSSVAIEAIATGKPTAIIGDSEVLPTNPLRGSRRCAVLKSGAEIAAWVERARMAEAARPDLPGMDDYFSLDPGLPRWRTLLKASDRPS
jgi:surface carbohydrate biosynthesis protein (TIGR04326 family)